MAVDSVAMALRCLPRCASLSVLTKEHSNFHLVRIGCAQVALNGDMYNLFLDRDGEPNQIKVGNVQDLSTVNVKDIGGIPAQSLAAAVGERNKGMAGGKMMVFPDFPRENASPEEMQKYTLPPTAPAFPSKVCCLPSVVTRHPPPPPPPPQAGCGVHVSFLPRPTA